MNQQRH